MYVCLCVSLYDQFLRYLHLLHTYRVTHVSYTISVSFYVNIEAEKLAEEVEDNPQGKDKHYVMSLYHYIS